jgi:hypothetical protein
VDINKLSTPEKIIGVSGIVLFIASFLPWFKVDYFGGTLTANAWDLGFLVGPLPVLLGLVMLAHVVISNFFENVKMGDLPWAKIHMGAGIAAGALILLKMLIGESAGGIDIDRGFGIFIGLLAGIGLAAGGFLYNKEAASTGTATTM